MAFENLRDIWYKFQQPLVDRMSGVDPAVLTWISLATAGIACWLLATAGNDAAGGWRLIAAIVVIFITAELDALDGGVARTHGKVSKYGDWLDHTIDRIVDLGLLIAIGMNADWIENEWLGWAAATFTLLGSYMGTQSQSVGLGRNYRGFSRADRVVTIVIGALITAVAAINGWSELALPPAIADIIGFDSLNGLSAVLLICLAGGMYTFMTRAYSARKALLAEHSDSAE